MSQTLLNRQAGRQRLFCPIIELALRSQLPSAKEEGVGFKASGSLGSSEVLRPNYGTPQKLIWN